MKISAFISGLIILLISGCKSDKKSAVEKPGIDITTIENVANTATNMDILFYNMDISLSQNDKNSLMQTAHFFAPTAKLPNANCPSIGRLTMQKGGSIILEADINYSATCQYFTIIENKVAKGTNAMTKEGVYFISQILNNYSQPVKAAPSAPAPPPVSNK